MDHKLNPKYKAIKLSEENTEYFYDLRVGKKILNYVKVSIN